MPHDVDDDDIPSWQSRLQTAAKWITFGSCGREGEEEPLSLSNREKFQTKTAAYRHIRFLAGDPVVARPRTDNDVVNKKGQKHD